MSLKQRDGVMSALLLGAVIFVIAFIMLMTIGDYRFLPAFFLAALLAFLTTIVLYLAFGMGSGATSAAAVAPPKSATKPDDVTAQKAEGDAKKAEEARARTEAAEAEAASRAAKEAEAAKAQETARQAEAEAARKADQEAEAAKKAQADASAKAAAETSESAKEADTSDVSTSRPEGEDYDGDGVVEGTDEGTRPAGLDAPRAGVADDLKKIKGVGPKMEKLCNSLGFWHFDQVAAWSPDEVAWVDANLQGFKGRVSRDAWVEQARTLAEGGTTEFSKRVDGGDVY